MLRFKEGWRPSGTPVSKAPSETNIFLTINGKIHSVHVLHSSSKIISINLIPLCSSDPRQMSSTKNNAVTLLLAPGGACDNVVELEVNSLYISVSYVSHITKRRGSAHVILLKILHGSQQHTFGTMDLVWWKCLRARVHFRFQIEMAPSVSVNFVSLVISCFPMSFTWASYIAASVLMGHYTLPNQSTCDSSTSVLLSRSKWYAMDGPITPS